MTTGELVENALGMVNRGWELTVLGDFHRIHCSQCTVCNPEGCHKEEVAGGVGFQRVVRFRERESKSRRPNIS